MINGIDVSALMDKIHAEGEAGDPARAGQVLTVYDVVSNSVPVDVVVETY